MQLKQILKTNQTKIFIYLCTALILGVLLLILINSTYVIDNSREQIENIVLNHQQKTVLVSRMRLIANERTSSLQKMLLENNPITISEELVHFNLLAGKYIHTWHALLRLRMDKQETNIINQLKQIILVNGKRQSQVSRLIHNQKFKQARLELLHHVLPAKAKAFKLIEQLSQIEENASQKAVVNAQIIYKHVLAYLVSLVIAIFIILSYFAYKLSRYLIRTENDIHFEKERSFTALDSIADAVITTDANGNIDQLNQSAMLLFGQNLEKAYGKPLNNYLQFKTRQTDTLHENPAIQVIESAEAILLFENTYLVIREHEEIVIELSVAPIFNRDKNIIGAVLVIKDVSEMRALTNELAHQACHDSLTGLLNRREFENRLEQTITEIRRYPDEQAWFCYMDLDRFKIINDTCGHLAGDELLKQIAHKIIHTTRDVDYIGRMGGDEFTIVLKRCDRETARKIMERIRNDIHDMRFCWDNKCFTITISIGIAEITAQSGNAYDILKAADTACYIAKESGRNRIHIFDEDDKISTHHQGEMEWVHRIYRAIETGQFVLFYQEIKALKQDTAKHSDIETLHGELLIRMIDDDGNIIPPYAFIPAAERYGLMPEVDRHVVHIAISTISRHFLNPDVRNGLFAINLSAQSLSDDGFLEFVQSQLSASRVKPSNLCFEITETAAISNLVKATQFITSLKEKGCYFALDDFGSGLSSFAYLKNLPVDFIKIDGGFVKNMLTSSLDQALVSSVNQIGHVVGMKTIAEFVETHEIEEHLGKIGIDYAQGYGIARPEPFNSLINKVLARHNQTKTG